MSASPNTSPALPPDLEKRVRELYETGKLEKTLDAAEAKRLLLDAGRALGQSTNEQRRADHQAIWKAWIAEFKTTHPYLTNDDLAARIYQRSQERGIRFKNGKSYSLRHIADFVKATRAAMLFESRAAAS